jgi:hypothetical protein
MAGNDQKQREDAAAAAVAAAYQDRTDRWVSALRTWMNDTERLASTGVSKGLAADAFRKTRISLEECINRLNRVATEYTETFQVNTKTINQGDQSGADNMNPVAAQVGALNIPK